MRLTFAACVWLAVLAACLPGGEPPSPPTLVAPTQSAQPTPSAATPAPPTTAAPGSGTIELPIFDTHVHYSQNAWQEFAPADIIGKLTRANVPRALVSSSPDEGTRRLYALDPGRIVPFLRLYYDDVGTSNWYQQEKVLPYMKERLQTPIYRGIGELHLHFSNANAPIVRETARLAVERGLFLHVHSDAQAVRLIFAYEPSVKILWAHAGLSESPQTVMELMDAYQNLWADISIRESEIAPNEKLAPDWRQLFVKHAERITIGSDTWVPSRWESYEQIITFDRRWLNQLPRDVAEKIAYRNAVRLFGAGPHQHLEK